MYNIDTLTLCMSCSRGDKRKNVFTGKYEDTLDWEYTARMQQKIIRKMVVYENDIKNMSSVIINPKGKYIKAPVYWHKYYNGYRFTYFENWHSLTVMIPHYKIQKLAAKVIVELVRETIMVLFKITDDDMNSIYLNRIDIKCDYRYADEEEFKIIKNIIDKVTDNYYCYQKEIKQNDEKGYLITFIKNNDNKYKNSKGTIVESKKIIKNKLSNEEFTEEDDSGGYMQVTEYNKTLEIEQQIAEGKLPESYRDKYINVFRTEVRIKNKRLNYFKNTSGILKTLENYYDSETTSQLYEFPTKRIFGVNDFYRIDEALNIINGSSMRQTTKDKLCRLILLVNEKGCTIAKKEWNKMFSEKTYANHKKKIESLGLNIISYDDVIDNKAVSVETIKNFTLLKNRIADCLDGETTD